jgi:hypothetical protein
MGGYYGRPKDPVVEGGPGGLSDGGNREYWFQGCGG